MLLGAFLFPILLKKGENSAKSLDLFDQFVSMAEREIDIMIQFALFVIFLSVFFNV